ncbi:MAG: adenylate/guanylate cyclase domain-containing protein [Phycisphaerales bacterium]
MRLGTKIMLVTTALVVVLTAAIVLIVRDRVRAQELARVPAEIHRAVSAYFARLDGAAENTQRVARLLFEEPSARAALSNLNRAGASDDIAKNPDFIQFRDYLFAEVMQRELAVSLLDGGRAAPAFHAMFDESGRRLLLVAPGDAALERALGEAEIAWSVDEVVDGSGRRVTQYLSVNDALYVALGVPVSTSVQGGEPPSNAYFVGYMVDDKWAGGFVSSSDKGEAVPLSVWFWSERVLARACPAESGVQVKAVEPAVLRAMDEGLRETPIRASVVPAQDSGTVLAETVLFSLASDPARTGALVVTASLDRALEPMNRLLRTITLIGVLAAIAAAVVCRWIGRRIARPVKALVRASEAIGEGRFDAKLDTARTDEIGDLARGLSHMADGLRQRDFIKDTFGRFVDPTVVADLIADPQRLRPGGEQRVQTVLFADLEAFTAISEQLSPEQVVALLNEYLGAAADIVSAERGVVDKFIGDAVVAFWGPPLVEHHAPRAARAALKMLDAVRALAPRCAELGVPPLRLRVGIATGEMLVGNIGSASKFNYTVMGDTPNLGARLEGANRAFGTSILCNAACAEVLRDRPEAQPGGVVVREIDVVRVPGRAAPERVFEIVAQAEDAAAQGRCREYETALEMYRERRFGDAASAFASLARREGDQGPARALAARCRAYVDAPPVPSWDGVFEIVVK